MTIINNPSGQRHLAWIDGALRLLAGSVIEFGRKDEANDLVHFDDN